jgi:hypothetical protein
MRAVDFSRPIIWYISASIIHVWRLPMSLINGVGKTLVDFSILGKGINIALNSGGNITGTVTGVDGLYIYVTQSGGTAAICVPHSDAGQFTISL